MEKIGILAGNGNLPYFFYEAAKKSNYEVYSIGLFDSVSSKLKNTPNYIQINIGELGKLLSYLLLNKIDKLIMLGKVEKSIIYQELKLDEMFKNIISKLPDRKDETIVFGIMSILKENGIDILPQNFLLNNLVAEEKQYTVLGIENEGDKKSIEIGIEAAKTLGKLDVGQTVVVNKKAVVALEAIEGTDETIKRAGLFSGNNCIIVKTSRPQQDMRVDVPAIGLNTIEEAIKIKAKGIVIEAGKVLILDKEKLIEKANENDMFIVGVAI